MSTVYRSLALLICALVALQAAAHAWASAGLVNFLAAGGTLDMNSSARVEDPRRRHGVPATGAPWVVDSLDVGHGETYDVVFLADNPGIWMDHCHNLPHAVEGLMTHLMDEGVTTPFLLGTASGNEPE